MNMEDLRKISFEFRRVSSDMLNSITDDNNVYLIKFREFIDDNKIISIEPLKNLNQLTTLWASYNYIDNIKALENLTNLKYLYLNNNKIKDINSLKNLVNIEYLGLNYNKIKDVEVLQNLKNLKMSGISKNMINDLSKLSELNLEGGFFPWDQIIIVNAKATSENTYELDLNLLKDRNDNKINITNLNTGIYDKERNIIKWSDLQLPHNTTFQFNNGLLVYENNSFYGSYSIFIQKHTQSHFYIKVS